MIDSREQEYSTIIQDVMLAQHITNLESWILQYQQSIKNFVNNTATRPITLIKAHPEYTYDEYAKALNKETIILKQIKPVLIINYKKIIQIKA